MPLRIQTAFSVRSPHPKPYTPHAELLRHHKDLLASFGMSVDEDLLQRSSNLSQADMLELLVAHSPVAERPDLLIVAYAIPDFWTTRITAAYGNAALGGCTSSFAVSEQGLGAPFSALRIAAAHHQAGRCATAVIAVLEQTTLAYRDDLVHGEKLIDSGVLLVLNTAGPGADLGHVTTELGQAELTEHLQELAASADLARTLLVAGPRVDREILDRLPFKLFIAPPGSYCSTVWLALAEHRAEWHESFDELIICDQDPRSGHAYVASFGDSRMRPQ